LWRRRFFGSDQQKTPPPVWAEGFGNSATKLKPDPRAGQQRVRWQQVQIAIHSDTLPRGRGDVKRRVVRSPEKLLDTDLITTEFLHKAGIGDFNATGVVVPNFWPWQDHYLTENPRTHKRDRGLWDAGIMGVR
jgi:hypothetical protein